MPMKGVSVLDQRMSFVKSIEVDGLNHSEACRLFGISRPTGYALLGRYDLYGVNGLVDRSRAPQNSPHAVPDSLRSRIIAFKSAHMTWGPKKVRARLIAGNPDIIW